MDQPSDPIDWHLDNWRTWMHAPALHLGVKIGGIYSGAVNTDFESLCEHLDIRLAETTNAVIENELNPAQMSAIYNKYLYAVYRFPRGNFEQVLNSAKDTIRTALIFKGVYLE